jgi:SAM-dependent methyltransferase
MANKQPQMNQTLAYYNEHAEDFINQTQSVDMGLLYETFLSYIPKNGSILDAGCGSARDALAFYQKHYDVVAFDASRAIVDIVSKQCAFPIYHASFLNFNTQTKFDGIWACASLLHVPTEDQVESILHLSSMLKIDGVFYLSYKLGKTENEHNGRYFCNFDEPSFSEIAQQLTDLHIVEQWVTTDQRKNRAQEQWFNVILRKQSRCNE